MCSVEDLDDEFMCGSSGRFDKKHDGCYSWTRFVRTARGRRECGKSCMRNFHGDFSWDDDFFSDFEKCHPYILAVNCRRYASEN